jgi:hypothetical protein
MADQTRSHHEARWLLLIHQIPPKPAYLRVKVGRQLARVGAVPLKNTVYVLPVGDAQHEDFQWVRREVLAAGGEATVLEAKLLEGVDDGEVEALFRSARDVDFIEIERDARALDERCRAEPSEESRAQRLAELARVERRLAELAAIDFFAAPAGSAARALVASVRALLVPAPPANERSTKMDRSEYRSKVWVTRAGAKVDRIACGWFVRRFIDAEAQFKFVAATGYVPLDREVRFDMFDAEFSHDGDQCTLEVLVDRFGVDAPGLRAVAEVVHDIDVKDGKFGRPETAGVAAQLDGLASIEPSDDARITRGGAVFDALLAYFAQNSGGAR